MAVTLDAQALIARKYIQKSTDHASSFEDFRKCQLTMADHLFYNARNRLAVMTSRKSFAAILSKLQLLPAIRDSARLLDTARKALRQCFLKAEKDASNIKFTTAASMGDNGSTLYDTFSAVLNSIRIIMINEDREVFVLGNGFTLGKHSRDLEEMEAGQGRNAISALASTMPPPALPGSSTSRSRQDDFDQRSSKSRKVDEGSSAGSS